jgi:hypothetical protein
MRFALFVDEIEKYLLKTKKCLLSFVGGGCHVGFLLGELMSVNRNISTKEMLFNGSDVRKGKLPLCLINKAARLCHEDMWGDGYIDTFSLPGP